jgi:Tfp pilus assembly protein PilE
MRLHALGRRARRGLTLIELAVLLATIGVLTGVGAPRFADSIERSRATEAFAYLAAIRESNDRYHDRHGVYAADLQSLDVVMKYLKYFQITNYTAIQPTSMRKPSWTMTLTRDAADSTRGAYAVTFTQDGFDPTSTITARPEIMPHNSHR